MRSIIRQSVQLPAPGADLFRMYLDPGEHAAFTGQPVTIGPDPCAEFSAFGGLLSGFMLAVIEPALIIQSWRSASFHSDDQDSTLILQFDDGENNGCIELVHLDVPDHDHDGVTQGWKKYYWDPWRAYLGPAS